MNGPLHGIEPRDLAILESRATALAGKPEAEAGALVRVLVFRLGGATFGLPVETVREVVDDATPTPVPGAPEAIRGVISLRGEIVSVTDPAVRLGLGPAAGPRAILVVIAQGGVSTALAVDSIADIVEVAVADIESPLPLMDRAVADAVCGSFPTPEGPVALLSVAPLLEPVGSER